MEKTPAKPDHDDPPSRTENTDADRGTSRTQVEHKNDRILDIKGRAGAGFPTSSRPLIRDLAEDEYASDLSKLVESRFKAGQRFVLECDLPVHPGEPEVDPSATRPMTIMLRVSSPEQRTKGDSPFEQLEELVPIFRKNGWRLGSIFWDDESGRSDDHGFAAHLCQNTLCKESSRSESHLVLVPRAYASRCSHSRERTGSNPGSSAIRRHRCPTPRQRKTRSSDTLISQLKGTSSHLGGIARWPARKFRL
jgi:hypothetical protein